jgi:hypothetical protein
MGLNGSIIVGIQPGEGAEILRRFQDTEVFFLSGRILSLRAPLIRKSSLETGSICRRRILRMGRWPCSMRREMTPGWAKDSQEFPWSLQQEWCATSKPWMAFCCKALLMLGSVFKNRNCSMSSGNSGIGLPIRISDSVIPESHCRGAMNFRIALHSAETLRKRCRAYGLASERQSNGRRPHSKLTKRVL